MGTRNIGYTEEQIDMYQPPHQPPPGVPIPMSTYAMMNTPIDTDQINPELPEHTYLAPRVPGYNTDADISVYQRENVYDALGIYIKEHQFTESAEAMKKANMLYQTQEISLKKRSNEYGAESNRRRPSKGSKHGCCMPFFMVVIGLLAAGAFVVTLLQFFGMLKCGAKVGSSGGEFGKVAWFFIDYLFLVVSGALLFICAVRFLSLVFIRIFRFYQGCFGHCF